MHLGCAPRNSNRCRKLSRLRTGAPPAALRSCSFTASAATPCDTWRRGSDGQFFWPLWLAKDIPGLAVWVLAYDAAPTNWLGTAMPIQDRARNVLERLVGERAPWAS